MKKFILVILTIFAAYIVSYYTVGEEKGYKLMSLNLDGIAKYLDSISKAEKTANLEKDSLDLIVAIQTYQNKDYYSAKDKF